MERVFGAQKEKTDSWIVLRADGTGKSFAKLAAEQIPRPGSCGGTIRHTTRPRRRQTTVRTCLDTGS